MKTCECCASKKPHKGVIQCASSKDSMVLAKTTLCKVCQHRLLKHLRMKAKIWIEGHPIFVWRDNDDNAPRGPCK